MMLTVYTYIYEDFLGAPYKFYEDKNGVYYIRKKENEKNHIKDENWGINHIAANEFIMKYFKRQK